MFFKTGEQAAVAAPAIRGDLLPPHRSSVLPVLFWRAVLLFSGTIRIGDGFDFRALFVWFYRCCTCFCFWRDSSVMRRHCNYARAVRTRSSGRRDAAPAAATPGTAAVAGRRREAGDAALPALVERRYEHRAPGRHYALRAIACAAAAPSSCAFLFVTRFSFSSICRAAACLQLVIRTNSVWTGESSSGRYLLRSVACGIGTLILLFHSLLRDVGAFGCLQDRRDAHNRCAHCAFKPDGGAAILPICTLLYHSSGGTADVRLNACRTVSSWFITGGMAWR